MYPIFSLRLFLKRGGRSFSVAAMYPIFSLILFLKRGGRSFSVAAMYPTFSLRLFLKRGGRSFSVAAMYPIFSLILFLKRGGRSFSVAAMYPIFSLILFLKRGGRSFSVAAMYPIFSLILFLKRGGRSFSVAAKTAGATCFEAPWLFQDLVRNLRTNLDFSTWKFLDHARHWCHSSTWFRITYYFITSVVVFFNEYLCHREYYSIKRSHPCIHFCEHFLVKHSTG